ncbi:hypothetical protein JY651_45455 [Pyxidicoccus parkwayensis]|uniref:Dickkopf N-terminal cysteine-rich domain-containing protein n=1 Tax=Pyxidicoccus parkwayensis TaxID=2813578 RepID=A0ABX7NXU7_9BACT|nr:hypothetical protein [Pyxidicoccus parkwaysis]QSQ22297.1 hypothetical protein JY651_45455 [Pyxidicoccus parkwaysis]
MSRASVLLILLLFVACTSDPAKPTPDAGPEATACEHREDCEGGQVCGTEGFCGPCESSGQCRLKERCDADAHACVLREGWGTDCTVSADCELGMWCREGLCRQRADVVLCPSGSKDECPSGQRCDTANFVCEEDLGCVEDADCGAEERCNTGLHACVPRCTEATAPQVCASGEHCAEGRCVQCEADAECGPGLICDVAGRCAATPRCYSDRDCTVPLQCHVPSGACLPALPPCTSDDGCAVDQRCDVGTGTCVPRACAPDALEPNDTPATAYPVRASRYVGLTLCADDVDYFSITLERGDQLGVNVEADAFAEPAFSTTLQDASGRVLALGHFLATHVAAVPGTYTVRVAAQGSEPRSYDVGFFLSRGTPCDDDSHEPNDTSATATLFTAGAVIEGMLCPQDQDHFLLTVPEGQGVRVSLSNYVATDGLLRLCLLGGDGTQELGCSTEASGATVSVSGSIAGGRTLTVRITGDDARTTNGYTLQAELLP